MIKSLGVARLESSHLGDAFPVEAPRGLRVLTQSLALAPLGGVEVCTLQDSLALSERGHHFDVVYGADGVLRGAYEEINSGLHGPSDFGFDPRRPQSNLASYVSAARWARTRKPDVLWLNRFEHIVWGQFVARAARLPLVCHLHGPPMYNKVRIVGSGAAHFIAVSDFIRDAYIDRGLQPERVTVVHNAIPETKYPFGGRPRMQEARHRLGLPTEGPIALCYGQMSVEKGVPVLLEAWRNLRTEHPDALLLLLDSASSDENSIVDAAVRAGLDRLEPDSYRWYPISSDVLPYLHSADVVVFPSLLEEAFGRVVIEGMATGRPVIASRIGAVPEILSGPMDRFLVDPGSVAGLTVALNAFLNWREMEPGLGKKCSEWVTERFPFKSHVDHLEQILQRNRKKGMRRRPRPSLGGM